MVKTQLGIIPARFASTRFPGKPLTDLCGKPMVEWVWLRAARALGRENVIVATEDARIATVAEKFGARVALTSPAHTSGTDRIAEVAQANPADIYINIQGDEPLLPAQAIADATALVSSGRFEMATAALPLRTSEELIDPSVVKVIVDAHDRSVVFSRFPIPYSRGNVPSSGPFVPLRHVGLYVYTAETLRRFTSLPPSPWELAESLEQLRALEAGIAIGVARTDFTHVSVDHPQDAQKIAGHPEWLRLV